MRLTHIFWALVVFAMMILLPMVLFLNRGKLNGGPAILGTFLLFWWATDLLTPIVLIIAWIKKQALRETFVFTLLAVLNLYFGLMGIYHLPKTGSIHAYLLSYVLFFLNLIWAGIIVYHQLRPREIHHGH